MTKVFTVAVVQFQPTPGEKEGNLDLALAWLAEAPPAPALVVLPEVFTAAGAYARYPEIAEPIPGPTVDRLAEAAAARSIVLCCGSLVERDGAALFNTTVLIGPTGTLLGKYRKVHLFNSYGSRERGVFQEGRSLTVVDTPLGRIGLAICYDLRFPEACRALTAAGAEVLAVPSAWPYPRLEHWQILTRARAVENQVYLAAANFAGTVNGRRYLGNSVVVDPWGAVIANAGEDPGIAVARVDLARVRRLRQEFPVMEDIRPAAYHVLTGALSLEPSSVAT
ncbi:MAG: carbon-nitrogen family hydrolase [Candidatus Rokubacteria bacterium]|nr:carbon-nitrogen family hydrolase [Candidatus Rokubacteria bacterium]